MAVPRVFVSSTCYDLKYIRENLKYFIRTVGYEPVMSEEGSVYYDPTLDTQDSCLREIPSCQLFVLIIGGRFGGAYKDTQDSITNREYREAVKSKIPVFALVENSVLSDYFVYQENKSNPDIDEKKITYPSADSTKIFDFIEEVRTNTVNNALNPFNDFSDMESYLRLQWAGMMFSFLTRQNEDRRVADTLSALTQMSEKIEFLSTQILRSIGTNEAKLMTELHDLMNDYLKNSPEFLNELDLLELKVTPTDMLRNENFKDFSESLGNQLQIAKLEDFDISKYLKDSEHHNKFTVIDPDDYKNDNDEYLKLRKKMIQIMSKYDVILEDFLKRLE